MYIQEMRQEESLKPITPLSDILEQQNVEGG